MTPTTPEELRELCEILRDDNRRSEAHSEDAADTIEKLAADVAEANDHIAKLVEIVDEGSPCSDDCDFVAIFGWVDPADRERTRDMKLKLLDRAERAERDLDAAMAAVVVDSEKHKAKLAERDATIKRYRDAIGAALSDLSAAYQHWYADRDASVGKTISNTHAALKAAIAAPPSDEAPKLTGDVRARDVPMCIWDYCDLDATREGYCDGHFREAVEEAQNVALGKQSGDAKGEDPADEERRLVHCTYCHKTHAVKPGETPCAPGAWLDPEPVG